MLIAWALSLLLTAPLVDAVKARNAASVRALLQDGIDVNAPEGDGATPLHWAAYGDDEELVALLMAAGARAAVRNDLGVTPLHLASANGNLAVATRLLAGGAKAGAATDAGVTALMEAARAGNADLVRVLLDHGAQIDAAEHDRQQTAMMWAVARRHANVVKVLLERGADVHARSRVRSVTVMLDQGPRRTVKTSKQDARQIEAGGSTALLLAAQVGDAMSAALLLGAGARVDEASADGRSPLVMAVFAGRPEVASVLLEKGADPNTMGAGYTALHAAALRGDLASVQALLAKGADPNLRLSKGSPVRRFGSQWALPTTLSGATPLLVAAAYLELPIMRALLAGGADHSPGLPHGTTPLLAAAGITVDREVRPTDLARWNIVDSDTPIVPRAEADVLEATRMLLDAGAPVSQANEAGDTALHAAASAGLISVIQLLAERGADLEVKNASGVTPLALTLAALPSPNGRPAATPGVKVAEELLRKLGARY